MTNYQKYTATGYGRALYCRNCDANYDSSGGEGHYPGYCPNCIQVIAAKPKQERERYARGGDIQRSADGHVR
jgi:hypothetical protein